MTEPETLRDWEWLLSDLGQGALDEARPLAGDPLGLAKRLRSRFPAERARMVAEQLALQRRAAAKFPAELAERMRFTRRGLEQSTDYAVATWKARRFGNYLRSTPTRGAANCWDLCSGIGGDLAALSRVAPVRGVDVDPLMGLLAEANARVWGGTEAWVQATRAESIEMPLEALVHIDPDRRIGDARVSRPEFASPDLATVMRLVKAAAGAAIKLAPAADVPLEWLETGECEWIERGGECRQQIVWLGALATQPGATRATLLDDHGIPFAEVTGDPQMQVDITEHVGSFLYEPSAAVIAAGLVDAVAGERGLERIGGRTAYLTGDTLVADAALTAFEVLEVLPFDRKRLKQLLRRANYRVVEVKKRGADADPAAVLQSVRGTGDDPVTLLLAAAGPRVVAIVARRVQSGGADP